MNSLNGESAQPQPEQAGGQESGQPAQDPKADFQASRIPEVKAPVSPENGEPESDAVEQKEAIKRVKRKPAVRKKQISRDDADVLIAQEAPAGVAPQWYVIHTLSGQENKVKENLESRLQSEDVATLVSQVLIPTENVSEVKSGKKTVTTRKFFPGYVLVNMILNEKTWYFIRNTSGVIGFIGTGKPVPLQDHEVTEILSQIEEKKEKVKPKVMFDIGENVKVNDGPFVNFTGTVEEVNPDRGKLKVVVSIFGRATPIELEYWQVERS